MSGSHQDEKATIGPIMRRVDDVSFEDECLECFEGALIGPNVFCDLCHAFVGIAGTIVGVEDFVTLVAAWKPISGLGDLDECIDPVDEVFSVFSGGRGLVVYCYVNRARVSLAKLADGRFVDDAGGIPAATGGIVLESAVETQAGVWDLVVQLYLSNDSAVVDEFKRRQGLAGVNACLDPEAHFSV